MKAIYMLLVSLVIVLISVVWIIVTPEPAGVAGAAHPVVPGMRVACDGAARYEAVMYPAFFLQVGVLAAMTSLLLLPFQEGERMRGMFNRLVLVFVLSAAVWIGITQTYEQFLQSSRAPEDLLYVAGFPLPSALAVYGVWAVGLLLTFFYVFGFGRFVYTARDRESFEALVEDMRQEGGG